MQPTDAMIFFANQSARAEKGLAMARSSRNYQLFALNSRQLFKSCLMQGLIAWRYDGAASSVLAQAVDALEDGFATLVEWNGDAKIGDDLPLERGALIAFLIERSIGFSPTKAHAQGPDKMLDFLLVSALDGEQVRDQLEAGLNALEGRKGFSLVSQSYRTYFDLLDGSDLSEDAVEALVLKAGKQFASRAKDGFYAAGEQTEGGGPDNALVLDYRLEAVLKKIKYSGPGRHPLSI